jgi:hypothetical protein
MKSVVQDVLAFQHNVSAGPGAERKSVGGPDRTVTEFREICRGVAVRPLPPRPDFRRHLESSATQMQLHEWVSLPDTETGCGWRAINSLSRRPLLNAAAQGFRQQQLRGLRVKGERAC